MLCKSQYTVETHNNRVNHSAIFLKKIAEFYGIDPMRLISSGSMLMIFDKDKFIDFKDEADKRGIKITKIGEVIDDKITEVIVGDEVISLSEPGSDELYKVV